MAGGRARASTREAARAHVAILLGTFNGAAFLPAQLESIRAQAHSEWSLWVSDDGSGDATPRILAEYRRKWGAERLSVRRGPRRGFCANFLALVCAPDIQADYYAFCDQDDLWDADKLARAVGWLRAQPADLPALYCGRTRLIDAAGATIGHSPRFARPVGFRNALVQSVAGGNTMVLNGAARALLIEAGPDIDVQTHDWWAYIVVSGCGGHVYYDPAPAVAYRQHGANLVGSNLQLGSRLARARRLLQGRFRDMNDRNLAALARLAHHLTPENRHLLESFAAARRSALWPRLAGLARSGVYCQTGLGNLGLVAAAFTRNL
jgi:glycosyltransferase involved in cell wall biosynthesis